MPKLDAKVIQRELEGGQLWPVYWLHGQEQMKSRELLKRIRRVVLGESEDASADGAGASRSFARSFSEELLDASETNASRVLDAAQSLSLGGGTRLIVVRDAHLLKEAEMLTSLLGPRSTRQELSSVCVFLSKDLDGRKKFSKTLVEQAAVVACDEIPEEERDAWISYLAKRKGLDISPDLAAQMRFLDPWSLDIIDMELEKYSIAGNPEDGTAVIQGGSGPELGGDSFLEAFFSRRQQASLQAIETFADHPDQSLPLLGLLAWNARFLALVISDRERNSREVKLSPYMLDRFRRWARTWSMSEAVELQSALAELDYGIKQTQRLNLGLWTELVTRFCS